MGNAVVASNITVIQKPGEEHCTCSVTGLCRFAASVVVYLSSS